MKIGITVDDERTTRYVMGKYDFYTREVELDPEIVKVVQAVIELYPTVQRILAAAYTSHGKFILPEDLEAIKCLTVKTVDEQPTPVARSGKKRAKQASDLPSSSESPTS